MQKQPEIPWEKPSVKDCYWYHTMTFPNGEQIRGSWSIPDFPAYVGGYDLNGKTVLDIGTASGCLAFNAEKAGAIVTGLDAESVREFRHLPFAASPSYIDRKASREVWTEKNLQPIKRSWWYGWHSFGSKAECIYAPHEELYDWDRRFDVVMAGAIIEHLSDPVYAIGAWARVAREAVLIPFVDVVNSQELLMRTMTSWDDPRMHHVWWQLSYGMYKKLFSNLDFDIEFKPSWAIHNDDAGGPQRVERVSLIARRRSKLEI